MTLGSHFLAASSSLTTTVLLAAIAAHSYLNRKLRWYRSDQVYRRAMMAPANQQGVDLVEVDDDSVFDLASRSNETADWRVAPKESGLMRK
jgi:hypothetical protein